MKDFMKQFLVSFVLMFMGISTAWATGGTEVLKSAQKDKVTIQYDISEKDGIITILFTKMKKELGIENSEKYRDYEKVQVVFFEWSGEYNRAVFSAKDKITMRPFRINRDELSYKKSEEGFFRLGDNPELRFTLLTDQGAIVNIPIYLAYYKKKRQYETFAYCGDLNINIPPKQRGDNTSGNQVQKRTKTITTTEEVEAESDLPATEIAKNVLSKKDEFINGSDITLEDLREYIRELDKFQYNIKDDAILSSIGEVKRECKRRLNELVQKELSEKEQTIEQASLRQQKAESQQKMDYINERVSKIDDLSESDLGDLRAASNELRKQSYAMKDKDEALANQMVQTADACDQKLKEIEDGKKRRNIWLVIGGVLLMVLMFVGNQTFSHFRNLKNQKGIEDMQKSIAKRAQDDARRRAQSLARSKINKVQSEVRQKSRDTVRNSVNSAIKGKGKNKKGFSI